VVIHCKPSSEFICSTTIAKYNILYLSLKDKCGAFDRDNYVEYDGSKSLETITNIDRTVKKIRTAKTRGMGKEIDVYNKIKTD